MKDIRQKIIDKILDLEVGECPYRQNGCKGSQQDLCGYRSRGQSRMTCGWFKEYVKEEIGEILKDGL